MPTLNVLCISTTKERNIVAERFYWGYYNIKFMWYLNCFKCHLSGSIPAWAKKNLIMQLKLSTRSDLFGMYYKCIIKIQANELHIIKYYQYVSHLMDPLPPPPFHESPVLKLNIIMASVLMMNFPPLPLPLSPACTIKPVHKTTWPWQVQWCGN